VRTETRRPVRVISANRFHIAVVTLLLVMMRPSPPIGAVTVVELDLTSLVLSSKHIVLGECFEKETAEGGTAIWCRAKKVYQGSLLPGAEFPLAGFKQKPASEPELIFFLHESKKEGGLTTYPSGIKVLSSGCVYRFDLNSPGQGLVPQRLELTGGAGEDTGPTDKPFSLPKPISLSEFEKDLGRAMVRVARMESARTAKDARALLDLLGPVREAPVFGGMTTFGYEYSDAFTPKILAALFHLEREEDVLEGASRCRALKFPGLDWPFTMDRLIAMAKDPSSPIHHRIAALSILLSTPRAPWNTDAFPAAHRQIVPLLDDVEPAIRRAAAIYLGEVTSWESWGRHRSPRIPPEETAPLVDALWEAWRAERDPLVRTAIFGAFNEELAARESKEKGGPPILFEGCVRDSFAHYAFIYAGDRDRMADHLFLVAVPAKGGTERRSTLWDILRQKIDPGAKTDPRAVRRLRWMAWNRTFTSGMRRKQWASRHVEFDPPLKPGRYGMWLEGKFPAEEDDGATPSNLHEAVIVKTTPVEVEIKR
jgi:hypothetical protein